MTDTSSQPQDAMNAIMTNAEDSTVGPDMETIEGIFAKENVPVHEYFQKDGLLFQSKPHEMTKDQADVVRSEYGKLLTGQKSAFYLALQPIYKWQKEKFCCFEKELLLRSRDGQQSAPVSVFFLMTAQERTCFLLWSILLAKQIANEDGIFVGVNSYVQDLEAKEVRDFIVETCRDCKVIVEITEWSKADDKAGYPVKNKPFTDNQVECLRDLAQRGIRISVDDYNPMASNYAVDQDFVRRVKNFVFQVKYDLALCSQIFENEPIVNGKTLPNIFPPAKTPEELQEKRTVTKASVEELRSTVGMYKAIDLVGEGSVLKKEVGALFPSLDPFTTSASIQGGTTHNWAEAAPEMHPEAVAAYLAAKQKLGFECFESAGES